MKKNYQSILIIKMSALGDIIHALPTLYELRKLYPQAQISWLVEPQFKDILPGEPYLDNKILFYKNDLKKKSFLEKIRYLRKLRRKLHSFKFDLVIDLQGLFKSTLVALLSGCKNRIGYCEMREGSFLFTQAVCGPHKTGHVVQRYLDVARYLGANVQEVKFPLPDYEAESKKIQALLAAKNSQSKYLVLFPGTRWPTKEWPLTYFAQLAQLLAKQKKLSLIIAGGAADKEKAFQIMNLAGTSNLINLTGQTSLAEMAALIKGSQGCIGGDTGPLHVAAALGIPTISLFGPVSPARTGAYGKFSIFLASAAPCAPCFKRVCPRNNFICMPGIKAAEVYSAVEKNMLGDKK